MLYASMKRLGRTFAYALLVLIPSAAALEVKLIANDGDPGDQLGLGVSISGNTVVAGAYADDAPGVDSGSAYVFVRNGELWTQQAKLTASDGAAGDNFGLRLSVSGDRAIVGSSLDDDGADQAGSAYIFVRSGTNWTEEVKLTSPDPQLDDEFGRWVFMDGDRVIVSCHLDDHSGFVDAGSAFIFHRRGGEWVQEAMLTAPEPDDGDWYARSVAIHGSFAVVGAPRDDNAGGENAGAAYLYERFGTTWVLQDVITAPDGAEEDRFGAGTGIGPRHVVIAAITDDHSGQTDAGSAYVFRRESSRWAMSFEPSSVPHAPRPRPTVPPLRQGEPFLDVDLPEQAHRARCGRRGPVRPQRRDQRRHGDLGRDLRRPLGEEQRRERVPVPAASGRELELPPEVRPHGLRERRHARLHGLDRRQRGDGRSLSRRQRPGRGRGLRLRLQRRRLRARDRRCAAPAWAVLLAPLFLSSCAVVGFFRYGLAYGRIGDLRRGDAAPDASVVALDGSEVRLSDHVGMRPLVLVFGSYT